MYLEGMVPVSKSVETKLGYSSSATKLRLFKLNPSDPKSCVVSLTIAIVWSFISSSLPSSLPIFIESRPNSPKPKSLLVCCRLGSTRFGSNPSSYGPISFHVIEFAGENERPRESQL